MDLFDVVFKLNGPVEPVGDSGVDAQRLANLRSLCNLTAELLECIASVADASDDHMASVKAAKDVAAKFMTDLASRVKACPPGHCRTPSAPCRGACVQTIQPRDTADVPVPVGVAACGNTPDDEGPFTLAEDSEALVLAIRGHIDGWASATFGWKGDPDPVIAERNKGAAIQAHAAECLRRIRVTLGVTPCDGAGQQ
jgi:hypothetical protein